MERDINKLRPEGFTVNEEYNAIYGRMNGINVLFEPYKASNTHYLTFRMDLKEETQRNELIDYLKLLETECPYVTYTGWNGKNVVYVSFEESQDEDLEHINTLISRVTYKCSELGIYSCCENCGSRGDLRILDISGDKVQMCTNCGDGLIEKFNEVVQRKEQVLLGIIGAIIGAVIGSLLWILLDQVHFIAGIAGYAIFFCAFRGYEMLAKGFSRKGVVICIVVGVLTILGADLFSFGIDIFKEFSGSYGISFGDALRSVPYFLTDWNVLSSILFNLGLGYVLAALGCHSIVRALWNATDKTEKKQIRYIDY